MDRRQRDLSCRSVAFRLLFLWLVARLLNRRWFGRMYLYDFATYVSAVCRGDGYRTHRSGHAARLRRFVTNIVWDDFTSFCRCRLDDDVLEFGWLLSFIICRSFWMRTRADGYPGGRFGEGGGGGTRSSMQGAPFTLKVRVPCQYNELFDATQRH